MNRTGRFFTVVLAVMACMPAPARADDLLVSAASSLTDAMTDIGKAFTRTHPWAVIRFNFGSSGSLQRQIEQGAPVDVFAAASAQEMDALQREKLIAPGARVNFAGNRLALIVPLHSRIRNWADLGRPFVHRIAISDPQSVPSGRYARETLMARRLWDAVRAKAVFGENVRQTLTYTASGDVDAGIVFTTDARVESRRVRIVDVAVPGRDHAPIVYPAAVVCTAPNAADALRFVGFLKSAEAGAILRRWGFATPPAAARSLPDLRQIHTRGSRRP